MAHMWVVEPGSLDSAGVPPKRHSGSPLYRRSRPSLFAPLTGRLRRFFRSPPVKDNGRSPEELNKLRLFGSFFRATPLRSLRSLAPPSAPALFAGLPEYSFLQRRPKKTSKKPKSSLEIPQGIVSDQGKGLLSSPSEHGKAKKRNRPFGGETIQTRLGFSPLKPRSPPVVL